MLAAVFRIPARRRTFRAYQFAADDPRKQLMALLFASGLRLIEFLQNRLYRVLVGSSFAPPGTMFTPADARPVSSGWTQDEIENRKHDPHRDTAILYR